MSGDMNDPPDNVVPLADKMREREKSKWRTFSIVVGDQTTTIASKQDALKHAKGKIGEDLERVIQHGAEMPEYSLVFENIGAILVGGDLGNAPAVRRALDAKGVHTAYFTPARWGPVHRCLVGLAEVETHDDGAEEVAEWIEVYFDRMAARERGFEAVRDRLPHPHHDGRIYISVTAFAEWLSRAGGQRITTVELRRRLRRLGFDRVPPKGQISIRPDDGGDPVSQRYWCSPVGYGKDAEL